MLENEVESEKEDPVILVNVDLDLNGEVGPPTVESIRAEGLQVMVRHTRLTMPGEPMVVTFEFGMHSARGIGTQANTISCFESKYNPKGGMTEVWVKDPSNGYEYHGMARCSKKDSYCKKTGVMIALSRALDQMGINKSLTDAMEKFATGRVDREKAERAARKEEFKKAGPKS